MSYLLHFIPTPIPVCCILCWFLFLCTGKYSWKHDSMHYFSTFWQGHFEMDRFVSIKCITLFLILRSTYIFKKSWFATISLISYLISRTPTVQGGGLRQDAGIEVAKGAVWSGPKVLVSQNWEGFQDTGLNRASLQETRTTGHPTSFINQLKNLMIQ